MGTLELRYITYVQNPSSATCSLGSSDKLVNLSGTQFSHDKNGGKKSTYACNLLKHNAQRNVYLCQELLFLPNGMAVVLWEGTESEFVSFTRGSNSGVKFIKIS